MSALVRVFISTLISTAMDSAHPLECTDLFSFVAGMVAASLACLDKGGTFIEVAKRDIWSPERVAQDRPDVKFRLIAIDFWEPEVVGSSLQKLAGMLASGALASLIHETKSFALSRSCLTFRVCQTRYRPYIAASRASVRSGRRGKRHAAAGCCKAHWQDRAPSAARHASWCLLARQMGHFGGLGRFGSPFWCVPCRCFAQLPIQQQMTVFSMECNDAQTSTENEIGLAS